MSALIEFTQLLKRKQKHTASAVVLSSQSIDLDRSVFSRPAAAQHWLLQRQMKDKIILSTLFTVRIAVSKSFIHSGRHCGKYIYTEPSRKELEQQNTILALN